MVDDKTRWFEIAAVSLTGLLKFLFFNILGWHFVYVTLAVLFWLIYILIRYNQNHEIVAYWGFTKKNLKITFLITLAFATFCIILFYIYARIFLYPLWNKHIIYSIITYPLWGLIQQFLIMSLVAGNLRDMKSMNLNKVQILIPVALLFSAVHFPALKLVAGTFALAIFYCLVFLKYRNLYPLGLFHGWIGGFFYFWVINRDPWAQFIHMLN